MPQPIPLSPSPGQGKRTPSPLLERFRQAAVARGDSVPTSDVLVSWARGYILFHDKKHPADLGLAHVTHFLEHVVQTEPDPLPALAMARSALSLLYSTVLGLDLGELPHPRPPRVLDQLRLVLRLRHYSPRTEDCYVNWAKRYILFHKKRHPRTMRAAEVERPSSAARPRFGGRVCLYGQFTSTKRRKEVAYFGESRGRLFGLVRQRPLAAD